MKTPHEVLRATAYEEDGTFKGHDYFEKAMVKYAKLYHKNLVDSDSLHNVSNLRELFENMQYYMEYCQMKGYVTPQNWIEKHKHF